jgi:hypothetical protein
MSARAQIENNFAHYAWAYDMDQLDSIGDCFTEDAEVVFRSGLKVGRPALLEEFERMRQVFRADDVVPWHVISSVRILDETEAEATVTAFYTFFTKPVDGQFTPSVIGYYDDRFVNAGGTWRVERRRVVSGGRP